MAEAVCTQPATVASNSPSPDAMIEALKRKLIETNEQLLEARSRLSSMESVLDIEKREHEKTTSKLSLLLRKRTQQVGSSPMLNESPTMDVGHLHQQIAVLQQQLRISQENEVQLRSQLNASSQQYEKLRLLTLEGFRAQRVAADPSASPTGGLLEAASLTAAAAAAAPASALAGAPAASPAPQSVMDALSL